MSARKEDHFGPYELYLGVDVGKSFRSKREYPFWNAVPEGILPFGTPWHPTYGRLLQVLAPVVVILVVRLLHHGLGTLGQRHVGLVVGLGEVYSEASTC